MQRAVEVERLSPRELCEGGPGEWAPLLGTPKNIRSKALEMGLCFYRGPASGEHGGLLLS